MGEKNVHVGALPAKGELGYLEAQDRVQLPGEDPRLEVLREGAELVDLGSERDEQADRALGEQRSCRGVVAAQHQLRARVGLQFLVGQRGEVENLAAGADRTEQALG